LFADCPGSEKTLEDARHRHSVSDLLNRTILLEENLERHQAEISICLERIYFFGESVSRLQGSLKVEPLYGSGRELLDGERRASGANAGPSILSLLKESRGRVIPTRSWRAAPLTKNGHSERTTAMRLPDPFTISATNGRGLRQFKYGGCLRPCQTVPGYAEDEIRLFKLSADQGNSRRQNSAIQRRLPSPL
jgi:hypothetical protein